MEGSQIHINYLAVLVVTILAFVLGGLWYGPLFGKAWMKESGVKEGDGKDKMVRTFGLTFLLNIIISLNLSAFLGPKADLQFGLFAGLATGIGFVSASLGIVYLFSQKPLRLFLIDAGYQTVIYAIMGAILGAWK